MSLTTYLMRRVTRQISVILLFIFAGAVHLQAQVITTDPAFPVAYDSVDIYFDATQGNGGLEDFTGDVYAHTGVITDQSTSPSDWKYVVADWGVEDDKIKLTRVEDNLYRLDINPTIREYYGVPDGEEIEQLAFVFRNGDGSEEAKGEGGDDIFAQVYKSSFNIKFVTPEVDQIVQENPGSFDVLAVAGANDPDAISMSLYLDDELITEVDNDTLSATVTTQSRTNYELKLVGTDGVANDTVSKIGRAHV